jgi:hypothetical protein
MVPFMHAAGYDGECGKADEWCVLVQFDYNVALTCRMLQVSFMWCYCCCEEHSESAEIVVAKL